MSYSTEIPNPHRRTVKAGSDKMKYLTMAMLRLRNWKRSRNNGLPILKEVDDRRQADLELGGRISILWRPVGPAVSNDNSESVNRNPGKGLQYRIVKALQARRRSPFLMWFNSLSVYFNFSFCEPDCRYIYLNVHPTYYIDLKSFHLSPRISCLSVTIRSRIATQCHIQRRPE